MSRPKGSRNKITSNRFKSYEGRKGKDRHIRLTHDMLMHKACTSLSSSAFRLYCYMKLIACGNADFYFSYSCAVGDNKILGSKSTFINARNELIDKGFIDYMNSTSAKYKRETGYYIFSAKWHTSK